MTTPPHPPRPPRARLRQTHIARPPLRTNHDDVNERGVGVRDVKQAPLIFKRLEIRILPHMQREERSDKKDLLSLSLQHKHHNLRSLRGRAAARRSSGKEKPVSRFSGR